jgi:hypothetical protein
MKIKLKCEACKIEFDVVVEDVDKVREYMQCPFCLHFSSNPFYEGEHGNTR